MSLEGKVILGVLGVLILAITLLVVFANTDLWPAARDALNEPVSCDYIGSTMICTEVEE